MKKIEISDNRFTQDGIIWNIVPIQFTGQVCTKVWLNQRPTTFIGNLLMRLGLIKKAKVIFKVSTDKFPEGIVLEQQDIKKIENGIRHSAYTSRVGSPIKIASPDDEPQSLMILEVGIEEKFAKRYSFSLNIKEIDS